MPTRNPATPDESTLPCYIVDAFTPRPFAGNPAAVVLLRGALPDATLQQIAAEMNLSETAFVHPADHEGVRRLRWFTPTVEVPLCGHATVAASHVLLREEHRLPPLRFLSLSGPLTVTEAEEGWLSLDFPADPPVPAAPPPALLEALGCPQGAEVLRAERLWIVRLEHAEAVAALRPNMDRLARIDLGHGALGVSVTAPGDGSVDFVSRFFGPWVGVDEDPVTGVAHTVLMPYWARELTRTVLLARQLSARGGELRLRYYGSRVGISGQAVTVLRGSLVLPHAAPA